MKILHVLLIILGMSVLTACNFTLAADITPPPDYVSPTPMPTLGALFPAAFPDVQDGAAIYAQNCAACHGDKGLGDGPQSMQLPVTVPGIGLAEVARSASPAAWFKIVTQGNLDRYMPPFVGALNDQQRWDVIAYVMTLHAAPDQIAHGKSLFEANCSGCAGNFTDQSKMAALSEDDLVQSMKNGQGDIPAFGKNLSQDDAYAVAAYLRTLTFAPVNVAAAAEQTPAAQSGTPLPSSGTSVTGNTALTPEATSTGMGIVTGSVQMATGTLPPNLTVTLRGYDHAEDQTTGPQEVLTLTTTAASDGSFSFQNVPMPVNRIFLAEVDYGGITYRSTFQAATANQSAIALPPVKLYEASNDVSLLSLTQVHIYTDFATAGTVQVLEILAFSNSSPKSVVISTDGTSIPFIQLPDGAQSAGYEAGQDSAPFVAAGKGIAAVPSTTPYSIIAFFNLPYAGKLDISQPLGIDAPAILLLVPDGMHVSGSKFVDKGVQVIQNNNYRELSATGLKAGDLMSFSVSGNPPSGSAGAIDPRQSILIGGGILGILLIVAGIFLYLRDRKNRAVVPSDNGEFEFAGEVMDAILALDDLHRASKISDQAYQKRRAELKEVLRDLA